MVKNKTIFCILFVLLVLTSFVGAVGVPTPAPVGGGGGASTSSGGASAINPNSCENGNIGDLEIDRLKFTNNGIGDKDEWYLTDEIEVEVRIENNGDDDINDIIVEWGLYDKENQVFIIEDEEDEFNLDDDDERIYITFTFNLDPEDFHEDYNENDFVFYIKAYSDDEGEDVQCTSEIEEDIQIKKDDSFVILEDIELTSDVLSCGEELSGEFTAWNIGEDEEEDVFVMITNEELGINKRINIGDLEVLEDVKRLFSIVVPEDAEEKAYFLRFTVYDEDENVFENDEDDEAIFNKFFDIDESCRKGVQITAISDPSTPEAIAGEQFIIIATLRNTGDLETTYTVSIQGTSAWSSLASIEPQVVTLDKSESKSVKITLNIDEEAKGSKEFSIRATYDDKTTDQKIALDIEENPLKPLEIEIILPENDSTIKGDSTSLVAETNKDAICEYSLLRKEISEGSFTEIVIPFTEMKYTEEDLHMQSIEGLEETTGEEIYETVVTCTDNYDNTATTSTTFYVDLSEIKEYLILEDIGEYRYVSSNMFEIPGEDEEITAMYIATYDKDDDYYLYSVNIFKFKEGFSAWEYMEELGEEDIIIQNIYGFEVWVLEEDYFQVIVWPYKNFMVYIMVMPNFEELNEQELEELIEEPAPFPSDLIKAYLEKYPSDIPVPDTTSPTITLTSPSNDYTKRTTKSHYEIRFRYNVEDESEITYCELIIDGEVEETDTTIQKDMTNVFSVDLDRDNYDWKIKCIDSKGNEGVSETRELEIKRKSLSDDSSSTTQQTNNLDNNVDDNEISLDETPLKQDVIKLGTSKIESGNSKILGKIIDGEIFKGNTFLIFLIMIGAILLIIILILFAWLW